MTSTEYTLVKQAVFSNFLDLAKATKGYGSVREMIDEYGFTGPFAGLDRYITKKQLTEFLETFWR